MILALAFLLFTSRFAAANAPARLECGTAIRNIQLLTITHHFPKARPFAGKSSSLPKSMIWIKIEGDLHAAFLSTVEQQILLVRMVPPEQVAAVYGKHQEVPAFFHEYIPQGEIFTLEANSPDYTNLLQKVYNGHFIRAGLQPVIKKHPKTGVIGFFYPTETRDLSANPLEAIGAFFEAGSPFLFVPDPLTANKILENQGQKNIIFVPHHLYRVPTNLGYARYLAEGKIIIGLQDTHDLLIHSAGYLKLSQSPAWPDVMAELRFLISVFDNPSSNRQRFLAGEIIDEVMIWFEGASNLARLKSIQESSIELTNYREDLRSRTAQLK